MTNTVIEIIFIVLSLGILFATIMKLYPKGDWLAQGPTIFGTRLRPLVFQIAALQMLMKSSSSLMVDHGVITSEIHSLIGMLGTALKIIYVVGFITIIITGKKKQSSNQAL